MEQNLTEEQINFFREEAKRLSKVRATKKTKENQFSLTLYNSGTGLTLGHYPHPEIKNKYQTYLTIDDIPQEELFSK